MTEYNPKHSKPGSKKRSSKIKNRSPRLHDIKIPKEKHCRNCNKETLTERMCHPESKLIKFALAGGGIMGGKINDNLTAWLCSDCNDELSAPLDKKSTHEQYLTHAFNWFVVIAKTHLL